MVKFYDSAYSYDYSFPAVALAYFLRYPNPYSKHVLSTDVIDRFFDPVTQRLSTTRLHLKRSKLPKAVLKLLPRSLLGGNASGESQSYILETSTIDIKQGWMETESRNLEWTGVLSVLEKQRYTRPEPQDVETRNGNTAAVAMDPGSGLGEYAVKWSDLQTTDVRTTVTLLSRVGQARKRRKALRDAATDDPPKQGFFRNLYTGSIQGSIEAIGLRRAEGAQPKAKEGMKVVLERLRRGGIVAAVEGMRRDREGVFAEGTGWQGKVEERPYLDRWSDDGR